MKKYDEKIVDIYKLSGLCPLQVAEAQFLYKQCVTDVKTHQDDLVKVKEKIIAHIRKLICQGDTVLKEVGIKIVKTIHLCCCQLVSLLHVLTAAFATCK